MSGLGTGVAGESGDVETAASPRRRQEQQSEASDPHETHSEVRAGSVQVCDSQTDFGGDNALDLIWELLINTKKQKEGADLTTISKKKKRRCISFKNGGQIREMQIKATKVYHFTPTRMVGSKRRAWRGHGETGTLTHRFERQSSRCSMDKCKRYQPYDHPKYALKRIKNLCSQKKVQETKQMSINR